MAKQKSSKSTAEDKSPGTVDRANYVYDVRKFHKAFGHPAPNELVHVALKKDVTTLRTHLNMEECLEVVEGIVGDDIVAIADGLCDLLYVVAGCAVVAGIPEIVLPGIVGKYKSKSPEEAQFVHIAAVTSGVFTLNGQIENNLPSHWKSRIEYVMLICERIANYYDIPLKQCFEEVQRSNMSKLGPGGKPLYHTNGPKKGKVKKGPNYSPPDLEQFLHR